ncbi:hypothetical protein DTO013E5_5795 [Penicillium roqueforti]|uniref:AMP-dependent synthetase/ligase n=1 Tax=Penicillium roqueforti (strain FM164) TaxID=1365484 RepID=W6Q8I0_PENRF|nr:uncharacterized protein LCP9604111_7863 [Penicillium roqueforti]CDM32998.1 AMP-dependent synthetase/ligase [Penicillium roqueforti FM164]KAF9242680.1 hypothetical protein LCP9604111_7863 [Penicillium roqueforti]KAI1830614.1 hypothetical protein CBS147337_8680 [Penicillium roqueforti]KAI2674302.1 hypothetical protein CBS147355_6916 [Penicillium roqueforti]KAI2684041.1 hypothetical protein LCP963914a_5871 [Penicillium roqueforti]
MSSCTIYNPVKDYTIPNTDLLSLVFDHPDVLAKDDTILHVEGADSSNSITKSQCREYTMRIAHILREKFAIGAQGPGIDTVCCISTGQVLLPSLFYGVIAAGGVYSAASSSFTAGELARQVKHGESRLIVTSKDCIKVSFKAAAECGIPLDRVLVLDSSRGQRSLRDGHGKELLHESTGQLAWEVISDQQILHDRAACLIYSSGTTGEPKGVEITHENLVSAAVVNLYAYRDYISRQKAQTPDFTPEYRTVAHLPAAHIAGCQGYFLQPVLCGGTVYWMSKFEPKSFLWNCATYRPTFLFTVPPIYQLLVQSPLVNDQFKHMIHAVSGAAPMGPDLVVRATKTLGCPVSQTWGLSETTGSVTISPWDEFESDGSLSPLLPNIRLRIVDEAENDVEDGQEGEFIVQGPMVTKGYWKNEEATRASFTADGAWFKTGDLGLRRNGRIFIIDRKKEMIKYKGLQVAPAELEGLLLSHSLIQDVAVIGVPDVNMAGNELPRAYVVANQSKITEDAIKSFIKDNLASHKQLRGGVIFVPEIPKSPTGKILRKELRAAAMGAKAKL